MSSVPQQACQQGWVNNARRGNSGSSNSGNTGSHSHCIWGKAELSGRSSHSSTSSPAGRLLLQLRKVHRIDGGTSRSSSGVVSKDSSEACGDAPAPAEEAGSRGPGSPSKGEEALTWAQFGMRHAAPPQQDTGAAGACAGCGDLLMWPADGGQQAVPLDQVRPPTYHQEDWGMHQVQMEQPAAAPYPGNFVPDPRSQLEAFEQAVRSVIPPDAGAQMMGLGGMGQGDPDIDGENLSAARLHELGKCRPCVYLNSKEGCASGEDCLFCHLPHNKKCRPRPCKATRIQCKQLVSMLDTLALNPEQMEEVTQGLGARSSYMRSILKGKEQRRNEAGGASSSTGYPAAGVQSYAATGPGGCGGCQGWGAAPSSAGSSWAIGQGKAAGKGGYGWNGGYPGGYGHGVDQNYRAQQQAAPSHQQRPGTDSRRKSGRLISL